MNILFVNTGGIKFKYSLINARKRGFKIYLIKNTLEIWERTLIHEWIKADTYNISSSLDIIRKFMVFNNITFHGVVTFSEFDVPLTVEVQKELGLPKLCNVDPNFLRSKYLMRELLRDKGFNVPQYIKSKCLEEVISFYSNLNKPIVIKPVWGTDSLYVKKISSRTDLIEAWDELYRNQIKGVPFRYSRLSELQIEEYIDGLEISVETVTHNGNTKLITFTDKHPVKEPYFIETGHKYPSELDSQTQFQIFQELKRILSGFEIENAVCHTELKWHEGKIYIVEIAARPAGGVVPYLINTASDYDISDPVFDVALNNSPNTKISWKFGISSRAILSKQHGWIQHIGGINEAMDLPGIKTIDLYRGIGDKMPLPPDEFINLGKVIAIGPTSQEADRIALEAINIIEVNISENEGEFTWKKESKQY